MHLGDYLRVEGCNVRNEPRLTDILLLHTARRRENGESGDRREGRKGDSGRVRNARLGVDIARCERTDPAVVVR